MEVSDNGQAVADYMGALGEAFSGSRGRHDDFIDKVELIISGNEPHAMQLMQFTSEVRRTGRPVIWIYHSEDWGGIPQIGLVAQVDEKTYTVENCLLWMSANGSRARLVPDNFKMSAFRFDDDLQLRHMKRPPCRSFEAAAAGMRRAYIRLAEIGIENRKRGVSFKLPSLVELQQAA